MILLILLLRNLIFSENSGDISVDVNKETLVVNDSNQETNHASADQQLETTTEEISFLASKRKQEWKKGRPSKRPNNRFNQLNVKG